MTVAPAHQLLVAAVIAAPNPSRTQASGAPPWAIILVILGVLIVGATVIVNVARRRKNGG